MESKYHVLHLCNNHWKANTLATAIYSQWYWTYNRKMKPCPDNNNSSRGDSSNGNNSDNDTGDLPDGLPRKKARTATVVNNDTPFNLPESNSDVQCVEDNGSPSCLRTAL